MKNAASPSRLMLCLGFVAALSALTGTAYAQRAPAAALGSGPFTYHTLDADFRVVVITKDLVHPWGAVFLPDGSILVTERPGRLRIIRNGVLDPTPIAGVHRFIQSAQPMDCWTSRWIPTLRRIITSISLTTSR